MASSVSEAGTVVPAPAARALTRRDVLAGTAPACWRPAHRGLAGAAPKSRRHHQHAFLSRSRRPTGTPTSRTPSRS